MLTLLIMYLYPVVRTVIMSFFQIESVTSDTSTWVFNGMSNYQKIFNSPGWQASMWNMFRIWLVGGIIVLSFSLLFAVILTSGIRFKKFFRAAIYLPNVISAVPWQPCGFSMFTTTTMVCSIKSFGHLGWRA